MKIDSIVLATALGLASQAAMAVATGEAAAYPQGERFSAASGTSAQAADRPAAGEPQYVLRGDVVVANPAYGSEPGRSAAAAAASGAAAATSGLSRTLLYIN